MRPFPKVLLPGLAISLTIAACGGSGYGAGSSSKATGSYAPAGASSSSSSTTTSGSSAAAGAHAPAGPASTVRIASNATLGTRVLTDGQGMTLYVLSAERGGRFICTTSACLQLWHPLRAPGSGTPGAPAALGSLRRPDGSEQVSYRGMPLYTFAQDRRPGEVRGQRLKDVGTWSAATVAATGATAVKSTGSAPSTQPTHSMPPAPSTKSTRSTPPAPGYGY
jgi:predicted lipoprotein with Yx(FWY)xxD motif